MALHIHSMLISVLAIFAVTAFAEPERSQGHQPGTSVAEHDTSDLVLLQQKADWMMVSGTMGSLMPPLMILQRGCTGSSVVIRIARTLMTEIGNAPYPLKTKEIVRTGQPQKNPWYQKGDDIGDALRRGVEEASAAGQALLFNAYKVKPDATEEQEVALNRELLALNTKVVVVHRENALDTLVCEVRDCFSGTHGVPRGYPVRADGTKATSCFDRRHDGEESFAMVDTDHLKENLATDDGFGKEMLDAIEKLGLEGGEMVTFEDLTSHEYSADNLVRSTEAWTKLLTGFGLDPDARAVRAVLEKEVGSYHAPEPHSETIFNVDEVEEALKQVAPDMLWMLRK
eukprot:CAMPEP_0170592654 /NCGR_PEP_ID=MMETSP0224-20130122/13035_1 /TAXON_ID=285029 /ORGANISM="Togula jolla, Strain CCCM 725" /LENGTH=341 /DNA_ID=CAMNT_0010916565 /DNA_START=69 /DNA_END=1094 /DNA_ORIENTATION=+